MSQKETCKYWGDLHLTFLGSNWYMKSLQHKVAVGVGSYVVLWPWGNIFTMASSPFPPQGCYCSHLKPVWKTQTHKGVTKNFEGKIPNH